jgi:hypothetical protein
MKLNKGSHMMGKHHMSQYIEDLCIHNIEVPKTICANEKKENCTMPLNVDWHVSNNFHLALMMIVNCWMARGEVVSIEDPYIKGMSLNKSLM